MPIAVVPATLDRLLAYLAACGGVDRFEFHDFRGDPDPLAARHFAEEVRERYSEVLGIDLGVEQSANRVTLRALQLPIPAADPA
jgi:hypothetical protein